MHLVEEVTTSVFIIFIWYSSYQRNLINEIIQIGTNNYITTKMGFTRSLTYSNIYIYLVKDCDNSSFLSTILNI